jgi:hypothetical protein
LGTVGTIISAALYPALAVLLGEIINAFDPFHPASDFMDILKKILIASCIIGGIAGVFSYMFFAFYQHLAENITFDLRRRFLHHLLL